MNKKSQKQELPEPEWSYKVKADEIEGKPLKINIEPNKLEKKALAERLSILAIDDLKADLILQRTKGNMSIHVSGCLEANVQQNCVVSTEAVVSEVKEEFQAWFADPEQAVSINKAKHDLMLQKGQTELPILSEEDDPEPIMNGEIDLGDLVTQYLSLGINPYPHKEGIHYEHGDDKEPSEPSEIRKNPFAALKDWKDRHKKS